MKTIAAISLMNKNEPEVDKNIVSIYEVLVSQR